MVVSPSVSMLLHLLLGVVLTPSQLQLLAQTWVVFFIRNKQGQVSPCLCIVSQPKKTEVGSVVCLDIVHLPDTQNSDAAIPLCRVSEKFEGD